MSVITSTNANGNIDHEVEIDAGLPFATRPFQAVQNRSLPGNSVTMEQTQINSNLTYETLTPGKVLNTREYKSIWTNDIHDQFEGYFRSHEGKEYRTLDDSALGNMWFFTMKFDEREVRSHKHQVEQRPYGDMTLEFNEFNLLVNALNRQIYGSRNRDRCHWTSLPFIVVAADFRDSKYARCAPDELHDLHLHAVAGFPPSYREQAQEAIAAVRTTLCSKPSLRLFSTETRFDPFDPAKGSVFKMIEYALKGDALLRDGERVSETLRIYPKPNGKSYSYPVRPKQLDG